MAHEYIKKEKVHFVDGLKIIDLPHSLLANPTFNLYNSILERFTYEVERHQQI